MVKNNILLNDIAENQTNDVAIVMCVTMTSTFSNTVQVALHYGSHL